MKSELFNLEFNIRTYRIFFLFALVVGSCSPSKKNSDQRAQNVVSFVILQINDFYEIAPLENGNVGGVARISSVRKKVLQENENTLTVLAGDFLSPTLLGTLKWEGERIKGKQMIESLNALGLDLATFGNHEFDLDEASLQQRLNESKFNWVSTNVSQVKNQKASAFSIQRNNQWVQIPKYKILRIKNEHGTPLRIGIVAPCLPANRVDYVHYDDIYESTSQALEQIRDSADFFISLSHLNKEDDLEMAKRFPQLNLILGGHEHENMLYNVGKTRMTKADANAKSIYRHNVEYNVSTKKYKIQSKLIKLDQHILPDQALEPLVEKWKSIETKIIRQMGFEPDEVLLKLSTPYDAREQTTRNNQCPFGELIAKSMFAAYPGADAAIVNSGGIRVDDMLSGSLSQYDILRSLPYGGAVLLVSIKGSLLRNVINIGEKNRGSGGYLQRYHLSQNSNQQWFVGTEILKDEVWYKLVINDYLLTGKEKGLSFLTRQNPEIKILSEADPKDKNALTNDIRSMLIDYIKKGGR